MASLTLGETTTGFDLALRSRLSMSLSAARDAVVVVTGRQPAFGAVAGEQYAPAAPCGPSNGLAQQVVRPAAVINQSKSIKHISDEARTAADHNGMGAFVTSLGSRPPSPPV
ncbi:hypothetical protein [Microlunatus sp. Gsoil 973]|jgi:hypothetical protein|uniref:hypothetical protein n=1 Tax=Microlunatus sp. Gsoil 973 TaxID=2672569 RepID=UPI0012B47C23|nr:hypothetical protein [Microlunatus sp. Gsoil 973]QGN32200.1 hypothetical protein GJV80_04660 [Microlunatus sp. Gsoil 973]